eukprot:Rmarinus@m.4497
MTIHDNTVEVCRYVGRMLSVANGASIFTLAKDAYFVAENNTMSSQCDSTDITILLIKTDLYIDANATMTISNNNVINPQGISNCVSFDNLHLGGVLDVRGNTAVGSVRNTTMGQEGLVGVFGVAEGSVAQFRFVDNTMNMTTIGPLRERLSVFDDVYVVFTDFNTSSMSSSAPLYPLVVIANNTATWTGNAETRGNSGAIFAYLIIKGVPVPTGEFIHLINNTMTTTDFAPVYGLYLEMPPTPSSTIAVLNNNRLASGVGTPAWSALVLNTSSVDITT